MNRLNAPWMRGDTRFDWLCKVSPRIRSAGRLRSNRCEDAEAFRMPQARSIKPEKETLLRAKRVTPQVNGALHIQTF